MSQTPRKSPVLHPPRPALAVGDFAQAKAHYVQWLGFNLDAEWREAPGMPAVGFLSRDRFTFMINEQPDAPGPASIHLDVSGLELLVEEWNQRRPDAVQINRAPPYEFPEVVIEDPWGNRLSFEGKIEAEERERRDQVRQEMKAFVDDVIKTGGQLPTPEALRETVGPPLGVAIEVLNEYPEYGALYALRQGTPDQDDAGD